VIVEAFTGKLKVDCRCVVPLIVPDFRLGRAAKGYEFTITRLQAENVPGVPYRMTAFLEVFQWGEFVSERVRG